MKDIRTLEKEYYGKGQRIAAELSSSLNSFSFQDELKKGFIDALMREHRTLQQSTMKVFYEVIMAWAERKESGNFDERNKATVEFCKKIKDTFEKEDIYFPFI